MNSNQLFTIAEFNEMHHKNKMSIVEIAENLGTYPNKVRRLAKKLGAEIRNKSEAQKIALTTGRQQHPTKGKKRPEEIKVKISESLANIWENMDDEEKNRRSELAKQQWQNMSEEEKAELHRKANIAIREAAKKGSKLEEAILEALISWGYIVRYHQQHLIANEKMHLDMVLPEIKTIIEVDGPSHFKPIWGNDNLRKSILADNKKDGLLLNMGFCIIRILQKKDITNKLIRDILYDLEENLKNIKKSFPPIGKRKFVIGE